MLDAAILGQVALGYSPYIESNRSVTATRLTVIPLRPDATLDAAQLLDVVGEVWPASGGRVLLNVASESLLQDLLRAPLPPNLMVEVPAFLAADPANGEAIRRLAAAGNPLLIHGRALAELAPEVLSSFKYSIIDVGDEGGPEDRARQAGQHVCSGVRTLAQMEAAFGRGAHAVLGWPLDDVVAGSADGAKATAPPDLQVIMELIQRADKEEPTDRLETTLRRDPTLAFKLLRYINSPAFGLRVEINSFSHAIMMLGYKRLKRWLALLLATASKDVNLKPVMFAAVRRGLLMEELVRGHAADEMRNEVFICGVFSLLDRMFQQPFEDLLSSLPVPPQVYQALVEQAGPYQPYLETVRAIESESLFEFREAAEKLMMSVSEINGAQLRALVAAGELE